jgi:hypothetical protein
MPACPGYRWDAAHWHRRCPPSHLKGVRDCGTLEIGLDAYYKITNDLIDKGTFISGNFQAYVNFAAAQQRATDVVSNQYLFDNTAPRADLGGLTEFQYLQTHFIYTEHTQILTGSTGLSLRWILRLLCALRLPLRYGSAIALGLDCPFGRHHRSSQRNLVRGRHWRLHNLVTVGLFLRAISDMRS